jgi:hypothetical protein
VHPEGDDDINHSYYLAEDGSLDVYDYGVVHGSTHLDGAARDAAIDRLLDAIEPARIFAAWQRNPDSTAIDMQRTAKRDSDQLRHLRDDVVDALARSWQANGHAGRLTRAAANRLVNALGPAADRSG